MTRVLGFTGTRHIAGHEDVLLEYLSSTETVWSLATYDRFVTGACRGWDAFIGRYLARTYPDTPQAVLVPWNKSQVEPWWEEPEFEELVRTGMIEVVYMPEGTDYRDRNTEIVNRATQVFYCADYPEDDTRSKRSGTWMTKRIAEQADVPVHGIILNNNEGRNDTHDHV